MPVQNNLRRKVSVLFSFNSLRFFLILLTITGLLITGLGIAAESAKETDEKSDTARGAISRKLNEREGNKKSHLNLDVRVNAQKDLAAIVERAQSARHLNIRENSEAFRRYRDGLKSGIEDLRTRVPDAEAKLSPLTGALEVLRGSRPLTDAAPGQSGEEIVRGFLRENKALYGLENEHIEDLNFIGESISRKSGLRMVRVEQTLNDLPIFQSETRVLLDRDGCIVRSVGTMIPRPSAPTLRAKELMPPHEALRSAMTSLNADLTVENAKVAAVGDGKIEIRTDDPNIKGSVTSKLVYFPAAPGVLIPAWSQILFLNDADWYILTDAHDGTVLWRKNIRNDASTHEARFRVYVQGDGKTPADSPAPSSPNIAMPRGGTQFGEILPSIVSMSFAQDITASPNGWIDDCPGGVCTALQTQTQGNNAIVCMDRDMFVGIDFCDTSGASGLDGSGMPTGNPDTFGRDRAFRGSMPRDFMVGFAPPPQGGPGGVEIGHSASGDGSSGTATIDSFRRGAVTQLFYVTNWYHDRLYDLGFDTAAGNFQTDNFGGGGLGADRVLGDAQDNSGTDNANFATPPD